MMEMRRQRLSLGRGCKWMIELSQGLRCLGFEGIASMSFLTRLKITCLQFIPMHDTIALFVIPAIMMCRR